MSFLNPGLWAALIPLVSLPLILHLINRGTPKKYIFPSIQLIKQSMAQRSKLFRWRHLILWLLRTAFLIALLLAFLRPALRSLGSDPGNNNGRKALIVFDHSATMEDKGDGPSSRERAVHEAVKLIDSLGAHDEINVLLMDFSPTSCFVTFSKDTGQAKRFVEQIKPGFGRADVNLASTAAARLIGQTDARLEVYYLSDFTRKKWANANFRMLPPSAKLFFVDVGPSRRDNRAILDARVSENEILAGDTIPLEVTIGNFAGDAFNGRVTVSIDKKYSFDQEVAISPWSEAKVSVPVSVGGPGLHQCEVRLPDDALESDNHFAMTISALEKEEVLIVNDNADEKASGAYYLKTALNPFPNGGGSLQPEIIPSSALSPTRLAGVQKVFLTQSARLSTEEADALAKFVFRGGGLIYFLDGQADAENLAAMEKIFGPNAMPLRLSHRHTATNVTSGAQQIARGDFKSRYLKLFQGAPRQDLSLLEFYDYYQAAATSAGGVLLEFGDGSPAMAAAHYGLGVLLLLNFSPSEHSGNLARQRIFPAWMQDLAKAVSTSEPPPSSHTIGESVHAEIWRNEMRTEIMAPDGATTRTQRELKGERCSVDFTPEQIGFYTLGAPRPSYAFAVNAATDQADLRPMDKSLLPTEFSDNHEAHLVAGGDDYEKLAHGRPIFHWFVIGALALLLLESVFQFHLRRRTA